MQNVVDDLVLKIYDAVAQPDQWQSVIDQVVDVSGAHGSILFEWNEDRNLTAPIHSRRYPSSMITQYLEHCSDLEAHDQSVLRQHTRYHDDIELLDDSLLAASIEELRKQPHVQLLGSFGIFHRVAGVMNKDNRWLSLFSMQLAADRPRLSKSEQEVLTRLLPHLAKALDLSIPIRQLQGRYRSVLSAIDKLSIGICILNDQGLIVARNEEFRRQQDAHRTFRQDAAGCLKLSDNKASERLAQLMSHASHHGRFGARPRKESVLSHTNDVLCVEVSPLTNAEEIGSRTLDGFVISSTDTSLPINYNMSRLQDAFGLTNAELALLDPISLGLTNSEIADRRERSVATINAQVKSILAKSCCANRTQLVRMLLRFGGNFLVPEKTNT